MWRLVQLSGSGLASGVAAGGEGSEAFSESHRHLDGARCCGEGQPVIPDRPVRVECRRWRIRSAAASASTTADLRHVPPDLLDDVVLLSEEEIAASIVHHLSNRSARSWKEQIAVGIAALLAGKGGAGQPIPHPVSRNIDMGLHRDIVCGMAKAEHAA